MDRLHQELVALPGLVHLSTLQLHDLPWRTKEQVLLSLFREQVSSKAVAEELQNKSRDRRLERKADKVLELDRIVVRKKEETFRADFMQVAAAELARLGAPALLSWQKLVFDNECCMQAFRLLLTRIKSSRRSVSSAVGTNSSSLLAARYSGSRQGREGGRKGDSNVLEDDEGRDWDGDFNNQELKDERGQQTRFPPLKRTQVSSTRIEGESISSSVKSAELDWNSDTTIQAVPEDDDSEQFSGRRSVESKSRRNPTCSRHAGAGIYIEQTMPGKQNSYYAARFKKNQIQASQEENAVLTKENVKLREEIKQLEELNAVLQSDNNTNSLPAGDVRHASLEFVQRRMRLLQAQNLQLQRQVRILQDAMLAHENAETNLMSALNHWRDVINSGREEAKAAGADQKGTEKSGDRLPTKWMMAVPDNLMNELKRVEGQIQAAANASKSCFESKLRVSKLSASFTRDDNTSLKLSEMYSREPSTLAHLRVERVKLLENALASVAAELNELSTQVLERSPPKALTGDRARSSAYELSKSVGSLVLELGAFGVVVPTSSAIEPRPRRSERESITAFDIIKALSSTSGVARGTAGVREREKQAKVMLKQLHAKYAAIESEVSACQRETVYWRSAWITQDEILSQLAKRVRHLGEKKIAWCQHYLLAPMINTAEVFASFRQAYDENTTRQNPYLPLLVETLNMEHPMLEDALQQWQEYATSVQLKMDELVSDYEANRLVLSSTSTRQRSHQTTSNNENGEGTLFSVSEQVPVY